MPAFYEFFAGGGMARAGLGPEWTCLFANDHNHKKSRIYQKNWGDNVLKTVDVKALETSDLPGQADLVWGSFPCQDLSLAGGGAGLNGDRSGTFWPFWSLIKQLIEEGRAPRMIVLENVCGTLTSHGGKDFAAICSGLQKAGYRYGAMIIDAALFVPQSRPRLFVVALRDGVEVPPALSDESPSGAWHPFTLKRAYGKLSAEVRKGWIWWSLPLPRARSITLASIIEENPNSVSWHTKDETKQLLGMMSELNRAKVREAQRSGNFRVGCIYKRTRHDECDVKVQRAEIRFDDNAGCLRTPAGGSSRQVILVVNGPTVKSRLISSRETARLMGLPDTYEIPQNYNEAYHLTGDGIVVPVVRHLAEHLFEPILAPRGHVDKVAA
jgi:DNA (cytosine-5)-methyltransferase 1